MALDYKKVIAENGEVILPEFSFNRQKYKFIAVSSEGPWENVWDAIDTLLREDGKIVNWKRRTVKDYFEGKITDKRQLKDYDR